MPDNINDYSVDFDSLALTFYSSGDYVSAIYYGEKALKDDPKNTRLIQNLRWYNSAYKKYAYVTVLSSNDYINGVVVLDKSLKLLNSKYLLYCIVTPDISAENKEVLRRLSIPTIEKDQIAPPGADNEHAAKIITNLDGPQDGMLWWHKAMVKLSIFDLTQFNKIVYLDADMIVKQNIDELFDKPHMSAVRDCTSLSGRSFGDAQGSFNSGLLVIVPNHEEFENILDFLNHFDPKGKLIHDQWILQEYFNNWKDRLELHLDQWYAPWTTNFSPGNADDYYFLRSKIKVLHIIDKKPWNLSKEYFLMMMEGYPYYSRLNLEYIDILNYTIWELNNQGITSPDLKTIE